jgi:NADP-dependent aldehyde dehydrogenase
MGSTNPVFLLPGALKENRESIAAGLANSVTLGVGQFCTNPGIVVMENSTDSKLFQDKLASCIHNVKAATMLNEGIHQAYIDGVTKMKDREDIQVLATGNKSEPGLQGVPHVFATSTNNYLSDKSLENELFGPSTLAINTDSKLEMLEVAKSLKGHLTASLHGTSEDLENNKELVSILERKAGRLIINGFPTGVEVCHAMVHGGPFPATTDSRSTSVGTRAITRFTRPVCYQDFPDVLLPEELKDGNPIGIWRMVDGKRTKE